MISKSQLLARYRRTPRGQAVVVLLFFLAAFIVGPLSFFAYEVSLYNLAKQQLKACVDAAALAAGCSQSSNGNLASYSTVQTEAEQTAVWLFRQNSILGDRMDATNPAGQATLQAGSGSVLNPAAHQGQLSYQWINPTTGLVVPDGDPLGKTIRVYGAYGFVPAFANFVHMAGMVFPVIDFANGALPQLDVVLCFDLSSSMDDFTYVFCVARVWDRVNSRTTYYIVNENSIGGTSQGLGPLGNAAQACYYAVGSSNTTGTSAGPTWPNNYRVGEPVDDRNGNRGSPTNHDGKPTYTAAGTGNSGGNNQISPSNNTYTDMVVDVSASFATTQGNAADGQCLDGYTWPVLNSAVSVGLAVEASRGNLESTADATLAGLTVVGGNVQFYQNNGASGTMGPVVTPQVGWYNRYWQIANRWTYLNPIGAGAIASQQFYQIINNDADSHFGLVAYGSDEAQGAADQTAYQEVGGGSSPYNVGPVEAYPWGNTGNTPCPYVCIDPAVGSDKYLTCTDLFKKTYNGAGAASAGTQSASQNSQLKPNGSTDIAGALQSALAQLMTPSEATAATLGQPGLGKARPNSHRAVVLFTDGLPTVSSIGGSPIPAALSMGDAAGKAGIPVYCVGLCMTTALQTAQNAVLNDNPGGGIAGRAAPQSQYFQATTGNELITAFEAVARSLVQLVRNQ